MSLARMLNELKLGNGFKQKNRNGLKILDIGDTVPTDATAGYEIGAIFLHTDGGGGTVMYHNEGTAGSCDFNAASGITATQEAALDNNTTRVNSLEGTATVLTNATHVIEVATSDVATTGTVRAGEIVHTVGITDLSTIREAFYVTINSAYVTGDWTNAIVGRIEYTGGTGNASGGMAAAICSEMNLPGATQSGGGYYSMDMEMNAPESFVHGGNDNYPIAFAKYGLWGNATAMASYETNGHLYHLDGFTAAAGKIVSANVLTLTCLIGTTERYDVLSEAEDALHLGLTGSHNAIAASAPKLGVFTSDVAETGTVRAAEIDHTVGITDLSTIREALYVNIGSAYTTGDWTNAIVGRIEYTGGTGKADGGMAAAICAEMNMPAAAQTGGSYYSLDCEMNCPTSFVHADSDALPVGFIKLGLWGGAATEFDDHGVIMHIDGLTAGNGDCYSEQPNDKTDGAVNATLKVNVGGTVWYIPMWDNADGS
jgi:hypothetical protein